MSVIQHQPSQQHTRSSFLPWSTATTSPTAKSTSQAASSPCSSSTSARTKSRSEMNTPYAIHHGLSFRLHFSQTFAPAHIRYEQRVQEHPPHHRRQQRHPKVYEGPRSFEIISPSGKKQQMIFVERVSHITAQVEYGLIPADPKLRKYDEQGSLLGNEGMELLSPKVYEDTPRGSFFFAERRPIITPVEKKELEKKSDDKKPVQRKEKHTDEQAGTRDPPRTAATIPTLLDQLVQLGVLRIFTNVRCRSIQHAGACLVRILLSDSESAPLDRALLLQPAAYLLTSSPRFVRPAEWFRIAMEYTTVVRRVLQPIGPSIEYVDGSLAG
ncbi:hypothetical protein FRC17_007778 [Serendipita sp. 399]|nr:hypothetical protein FRC17_007778 [Serendipita sp. 399]